MGKSGCFWDVFNFNMGEVFFKILFGFIDEVGVVVVVVEKVFLVWFVINF